MTHICPNTIDFPSHFILFIIDVYRDTTTCDKLIFPSVPFPSSDHFLVMCAIDYAIIKRSEAQFCLMRFGTVTPPTPSTPSTSAPSSSTSGVTLSVMCCVRWTPVLPALLDARLKLVDIPCLPLLWPLWLRVMLMMLMMMRIMSILAHLAMTRCLLNTLTLCHSWQKGGVIFVIRVVILRGRISIGDFC